MWQQRSRQLLGQFYSKARHRAGGTASSRTASGTHSGGGLVASPAAARRYAQAAEATWANEAAAQAAEAETTSRAALASAHESLVAILSRTRAERNLATSLPPSAVWCRAPWEAVRRYVAENVSDAEMQARWVRQIAKETKALDEAVIEYTRELDEMRRLGKISTTSSVKRLVVRWFEPMREAIKREQTAVLHGIPGLDRKVYGPMILTLDAEQLAVLTIAGVMNTLLIGGDERVAGQAKLTKTALSLGKMVQLQAHWKKLEDDVKAENGLRAAIKSDYGWLREAWQRRAGVPAVAEAMRDGWARRPGAGEAAMARLRESLGAAKLRGGDAAVWGELGKLERLLAPPRESAADKRAARAESNETAAAGRLSELAELAEARSGVAYDPEALLHDLWAVSLARRAAGLADKYDALAERRPDTLEQLFSQDHEEQRVLRMTGRRTLAVPAKRANLPTARKLMSTVRRARMDPEYWQSDKLAKVGTILIKLLIESAEVDTPAGRMPAFLHDVVLGYDSSRKGFWKKFGTLMCHDEVLMQIEQGQQARASFLPRYLPMLVPPFPWTRVHQGAYLTFHSPIMRVRGDKSQMRLLEEADRAGERGEVGLSRVYEALNALGALPWRINTDVLEVVETLWTAGGDVAGLPPRVNVPEPCPLRRTYRLVLSRSGQLSAFTSDETPIEARLRYLAGQRVRKKNAERHSLRCDTELKLRIAQEYRDDEFYYPHNVDFRGRAYPMHPHLNHLGSDMCRGVMRFAESRPLGEEGLDWLLVHVANLYGAGKLSLRERREWAASRLEQVFDSADNPLGGNRWWVGADAPFQCLAACMEIAAALRSGDPAAYESSLPVHQDGSCNGLQHYAALGRDYTGGKAVNLLPGDRPADVYTEIAKLVQRTVEEDAARGQRYALALMGNVDRKLVKQTVMTSVYGVTFIGARTQISSRLQERGWPDTLQTYKTACYAARTTLDALHEMFSNAREIMAWLSECARLIAKEGQAVEWTTPLGLPVVQPYRDRARHHVRTVLQRLVLVGVRDGEPIQKARQRSAFPPNYVHSIDSSHMMMTAVKCRDEGIAFAGVHDSFWTHAGTVPRMNALLREQFVALHSPDASGRVLLHKLLDELRANPQYAHITFPDVPEPGSLPIEDVKHSQYFFS